MCSALADVRSCPACHASSVVKSYEVEEVEDPRFFHFARLLRSRLPSNGHAVRLIGVGSERRKCDKEQTRLRG